MGTRLPEILFFIGLLLAFSGITVPVMVWGMHVSAWLGRLTGHPMHWKIGGLLISFVPGFLLMLLAFVIAKRRGDF